MNSTISVPKHKKNTMPRDDYSINFAKVVEGKRVFTIAYRLHPERKSLNVEYGASVFRKDSENEVFSRRKHVQTARGRLNVRPVLVTYPFSTEMINILERDHSRSSKEERQQWSKSDEGVQWKELRRELDEDLAMFLRKEIMKHGVRAATRNPSTV